MTKRGRIRWMGPLRAMFADGQTEDVRRGLIVEFEDTADLQTAANSGFAEFDHEDDTVAIVLHTPKEPTS